MAKSKPDKRNQKRKKSKPSESSLSPELAQPLLEEATSLLQTGQASEALPLATKALKCLSTPDILPVTQLPVLELLGEICVELGDQNSARKSFEEAASLDPEATLPEESGGGADKFLWLAQLSEEGGHDSMQWFAKAFGVLRREIGAMQAQGEASMLGEEETTVLEMKKSKLANALCGATELYMTDLSWEEDAESRCESFVTEACLVAADSPEPLQTLASVRISQGRMDDARTALGRSLGLWTDLQPQDPRVPDFATRISLARLLMETELEEKAIEILDRLVSEDDSSVETWYLGGWCLHLLAKQQALAQTGSDSNSTGEPTDESLAYLKNSRKWLLNSLRLYDLQDYEDAKLRDHAEELVRGLNSVLGTLAGAEPDDDEDEWEEEDGSEDGLANDEDMAET